MSAVTAVPRVLGLSHQLRLAGSAARLTVWLDRASRLVFVAKVAATFIQNRDAKMAHFASFSRAVAALNAAALLAAFGLGRAACLTAPQQLAISVETGLQNVSMAIVVTGTLLDRMLLAVPALP